MLAVADGDTIMSVLVARWMASARAWENVLTLTVTVVGGIAGADISLNYQS